ncbi:hypothetical protein NC653_027655 [Populus alba x Populus x berolinensis]|uniref:Secreted protein n=2 Tax=Populus TaxID=3689 RepID=A0A4U5P5C5_POPAL|nr:hypothetical protein NC653_027655 [Populus alba x Populus x berolinensis]TKR91539.1 hypothetical protein D5086_0000222310 [Populus alba]
MGTATFFVGWLFVSAGEQQGEGEMVKICDLGGRSGCSGWFLEKNPTAAKIITRKKGGSFGGGVVVSDGGCGGRNNFKLGLLFWPVEGESFKPGRGCRLACVCGWRL